LRVALQWRHRSTGIVASISDRRIVGARHGVPLRRRSETAATAKCANIYVTLYSKVARTSGRLAQSEPGAATHASDQVDSSALRIGRLV
jgi:hypothetical protein